MSFPTRSGLIKKHWIYSQYTQLAFYKQKQEALTVQRIPLLVVQFLLRIIAFLGIHFLNFSVEMVLEKVTDD